MQLQCRKSWYHGNSRFWQHIRITSPVPCIGAGIPGRTSNSRRAADISTWWMLSLLTAYAHVYVAWYDPWVLTVIATVKSAWRLLMAWCLFGAKISETVICWRRLVDAQWKSHRNTLAKHSWSENRWRAVHADGLLLGKIHDAVKSYYWQLLLRFITIVSVQVSLNARSSTEEHDLTGSRVWHG